MKSGDHYIPAEQVPERYEKGMKLLDQYYNMSDRLTLIENIMFTIIAISLFTYVTTWKNGRNILQP
jgi:predicted ABC-type ATPase